jgi:hypothetical protein
VLTRHQFSQNSFSSPHRTPRDPGSWTRTCLHRHIVRYMNSQPTLRGLSWSQENIVVRIYFNKRGLQRTLRRYHDSCRDRHTPKPQDIETLCASFATLRLRWEAIDVGEGREAADRMIKRTQGFYKPSLILRLIRRLAAPCEESELRQSTAGHHQ